MHVHSLYRIQQFYNVTYKKLFAEPKVIFSNPIVHKIIEKLF
jgi:hypothetical protein